MCSSLSKTKKKEKKKSHKILIFCLLQENASEKISMEILLFFSDVEVHWFGWRFMISIVGMKRGWLNCQKKLKGKKNPEKKKHSSADLDRFGCLLRQIVCKRWCTNFRGVVCVFILFLISMCVQKTNHLCEKKS